MLNFAAIIKIIINNLNKNKKMKTFRFMAILGLCMSLFTFTACGDDDDNNTGGGNGIEGTWEYTFVEPSGHESVTLNVIFVFRGNEFEFTATELMTWENGDQIGRHGHGRASKGTYVFANNKLTATVTAERSGEYMYEQNAFEWFNWETFETPQTSSVEAVLNGNKLTIKDPNHVMELPGDETECVFTRK